MTSHVSRYCSYFLKFCFSFAVIPSALFPAVSEITSITQIQNTIPSDAIVFMGLEKAILYPVAPMMATPQGRDLFLEKLAGVDENTALLLSSIINENTVWKPSENGMKDFLKYLRQQAIPAMGVTERGESNPICKLSYAPTTLDATQAPKDSIQYTLDSLNKEEIDFSELSPNTWGLSVIASTLGCKYDDGVLFLRNQDMKTVIPSVLKTLLRSFNTVVAVSDNLQALQSLDNELSNKGTLFLGYHYIGGKNIANKYDPAIAEAQIDYLLKYQKVLSNKEAKDWIKN